MKEAKDVKETRVFGPPGTGKTTYTSRCITEAASKYGPDNILVASFTKAAAKELVARDQVISNDQIGTLHAHCYRMLHSPTIAETKVSEFNEEFPHFALSGSDEIRLDDGLSPNDDRSSREKGGDELMAQLNIYRARMIKKEFWSPPIVDFHNHWSRFKREGGYCDFQDLIERAIYMQLPPNEASIGIFDEAQDFTPSQLMLVRKWAKFMEWILIVGDDDQTLYSFTGASPEAFLNPPVKEEFKKVLRQSYRVPSKALEIANSIIKKVKNREEKEYRPRDHEGKVYSSSATWKTPDALLPVIKGYVKNGKRVMILTTCSYMLTPMLMRLRDAGLPFSNMYKTNRGDWNPIRKKQTGNAGSFGRLCAYMHPDGPEFKGTKLWTPQQLESWCDPIKADGNFKKGMKKKIKQLCASKHASAEEILGIMLNLFEDDAFDRSVERDIEWFLSQITPSKQSSFAFPSKIYSEFGTDGPEIAQLITVGTVHSVKGGEADVVIVFPDISLRGAQHYATRSGEQYEQILRQFYVAVTRTRDVLILCQGVSNGMFFNDYR